MPHDPPAYAVRAHPQLVEAARAGFERFSAEAFTPDANGRYPPLRAGQATLGFLYPALHLHSLPRPGLEAEDRALARAMILRGIRQGQFRSETHHADGCWHWQARADPHAEAPKDRNTAGFMGCALARLWHCDPQRLADWPADELAEYHDALRASAEAGLRLWVRVGYTNPQCLDFYLAWAASAILGENEHREAARPLLREFLALASSTDSFEEWISPTYVAVNLTGLVPLAVLTRDGDDAALFQDLLTFQWRLIAQAAHAPSHEICGPHSRAYGDTAAERAEAAYAWLHLAEPDGFPVGDPSRELDTGGFYAWFQNRPNLYDGLAAPGIYHPLGVPADAAALLASDFARPEQNRETFEWIGRNGWAPPWDLSRPALDDPPRFRLGTRYRHARFCLGSANELDNWIQRRPVLAYWRDRDGASTGIKLQAVIRPDAAAQEAIGDWLFQQAIETIAVQDGAELLGAFRCATVRLFQPGDELTHPSGKKPLTTQPGSQSDHPAGWFLGSHWRQPIAPDWRRQRCAELWLGITAIGRGSWRKLDDDGKRWAFEENGVRAVIEAPLGATETARPNLTAHDEPVPCLQLWHGEDIDWDWLDLPRLLVPFGVQMHDGAGEESGDELRHEGDADRCEIERGRLRLRYRGCSGPSTVTERVWRGWVDGEEILPRPGEFHPPEPERALGPG